MDIDDIKITLTVKKIVFLPTKWTGKAGQKPEQEVVEQFETEEMTVAEAIKYLASKWL